MGAWVGLGDGVVICQYLGAEQKLELLGLREEFVFVLGLDVETVTGQQVEVLYIRRLLDMPAWQLKRTVAFLIIIRYS